MDDSDPVVGTAYLEGPAGPARVELGFEDHQVVGLARDGVTHTIPLSTLSVRAGGVDGRHVFMRDTEGTLTLASTDDRVVDRLRRVADERLATELGVVLAHRTRHRRRDATERWLYRLRYPFLLALLAAAAFVGWLLFASDAWRL